MKRMLTAQVAALTLLLLGGAIAQAVPIPADQITWTYNFNPVVPGTKDSLAAVFSDETDAGGVTFTNEPTKTAVGSSDVVATNLRVFSTATAAAPQHLITNGGYGLDMELKVTDDDGLHSTVLHFTGNKLSTVPPGGKLSAEAVTISNVFGANSSQTVDLGIYTFTVSLIAYTPPGPPGQANAGSIAVHVELSGGPVVPQNLPEPSSMLLSGLGLSFLGGMAWRKRRARAAAAAV